MISGVIDQPLVHRQLDRRDRRPEAVDEAVDRNGEYPGVALLALVLNHPESAVVLSRIKRALASPSAQTRANVGPLCSPARVGRRCW
jgi:hypothetical protein